MKSENTIKTMLGIERARLKNATSNEYTVIENRISILNWVLDGEIVSTPEPYSDTEADGWVFCGKCKQLKTDQ